MAKHVFTDKAEISHLWANRAQSDARYSKGNFFFTGAALYSYGSHYLCGFLVRDRAFLNADRYSVTTSGHQSLAASATRHKIQHYLPDLTALYDVLRMADAEGTGAAKRKLAKRFNKASREHNAGSIDYAGMSEARAHNLFREWLIAHPALARDNDGVAFLADSIGFTQSEVTSAIKAGERKAREKQAKADKREREALDREGARIAALPVDEWRDEWPQDGDRVWSQERDYYGRRDSKPYDLQRMESYGRELSRMHKRAKAAGYTRRAAILWTRIKTYREHVKGRDARIVAAYRSRLATELWAWRRGEGKRPDARRFSEESFPAIKRRLERAEREESLSQAIEQFDNWQAAGEPNGDSRPNESRFPENDWRRLHIQRHKADEKQANESAYLAWRADKSAPRPPSAAFLSGDSSTGFPYYPSNFTASDGVTYSRHTAPEHIREEWRAVNPFVFAWQELREADRAEKAEQDRLAKEERERVALAAFRERGMTAIRLDDGSGGALLTVIGQELVTSWGARVPLSDAIKVFRFAKLCREAGKPWHANGRRVHCGHYQIDCIYPDGGFKAGCHLIHWPEIEAAARLAGVVDMPADDSAIVSSAGA